jgi:hypothetical protein
MSMQGDPAASLGVTPGTPAGDETLEDAMQDGDGDGDDPEALGHEREDYPDPESYPSPEEGEAAILDGSTPDADLQVDGEKT